MYKFNSKEENLIAFKNNFKPLICQVTILTICIAISSGIIEIGIIQYFSPTFQPSGFTLNKIDQTNMLLLQIIFAVVLTPIAEEIVFRKILFNYLSKKFGYVIGIIVSSILFASLHSSKLSTFIFAICMCFMYMKTKTIISSIFIHSMNNFFSILMLLLGTFLDTTPNLDKPLLINTETIFICGIISIIMLFFIRYFFIRKTSNSL